MTLLEPGGLVRLRTGGVGWICEDRRWRRSVAFARPRALVEAGIPGAQRFAACAMLACLVAAAIAGPASGALPRTYDAQRIDSPLPAQAAGFGGGAATIGDLDGDGSDDFAVGQNARSPGGNGQVFIFSGGGALLDTIVAPDPGGAGTASALFGVPFVDRLPDIGSCPGRTTGQLCTNPIGAGDGVPEILIGARGVDVGGFNDIGRAYVYDGATRALMKRIDMPPADRTATGISAGGTWYGRVVYSPGGLPPCAGNLGIGGCATVSAGVALGDLDGGGAPDIVVGASRYTESPATAYPGSHCAETPGAACVGAGRAYVYRGEEVAGSDPSVTLENAFRTFRNPAAQADDPFVFDITARRELFGNAITAVGDVGSCTTPAIAAGDRCPSGGISTVLDGRPEVLISGFRVDLPMNDPDGSLPDVGVNFLYDGATGALLTSYHHPEPQAGATFGTPVGGLPPGDLGGDTTRADVYIPAVTQNGIFKGQGRGYVMSGDLNAYSSTLNIALLNDPTPAPAGNFGGGYAAAGDLVAQSGKFRNELLVGAGHLGEPGNAELVNDIHVVDPLKSEVLQSIVDPDAEPGSRFGAELATLGDLNGDGFLDFLAAAPAWDGPAGVAQGRIYILRSDNSPAAAPPAPAPTAAAPAPPPPAAAQQPLTGGLSTAKMALARATINRSGRVVDVLAPITRLASGRVQVQLHAAGRRHRFTAPVNSRDGRIRFRQRIPTPQAELGTGILSISYPGDADTRPQTVRLRAAAQRADLRLSRPTIADGRLRASGTISSRARGVVRVQIEYVVGGEPHSREFKARISNGRWSLNEALSPTVRSAIAQRSGTVHSYTLFTGYLAARMRGEMRSFQILAAR